MCGGKRSYPCSGRHSADARMQRPLAGDASGVNYHALEGGGWYPPAHAEEQKRPKGTSIVTRIIIAVIAIALVRFSAVRWCRCGVSCLWFHGRCCHHCPRLCPKGLVLEGMSHPRTISVCGLQRRLSLTVLLRSLSAAGLLDTASTATGNT